LHSFPLRVPRGFVARMRQGDPKRTPCSRQVLPLDDETASCRGLAWIAVGDGRRAHGDGVLQKYRGRALLVDHGLVRGELSLLLRRHFHYGDELAARDGLAPRHRRNRRGCDGR
jgi:L-lysine 2,3-aminomutase